MRLRLLAALVAAAVPLAARGQDADHPFKNAKVGDYANYTMSTKVGTFDVKGTLTNTVKAVTDKEVTVEVTGKMNGMAIPAQTQKIDLTKAFDPSAAGIGANAGKTDAKVEKVGEGSEKITVGGKSYEAKWTTMKVTTKTPAGEVVMDLKAWVGKDIPLGLGRMEMNSMVAGMAMTMRMELTETGNKK
jgi:hypothetical protein